MRSSSFALAAVLLVAAACTDAATTGPTGVEPAGSVALGKANSGEIRVSASTTGADLDPNGYTASVDSGPGKTVGVNASATFKNVLAGTHRVQLTGIAGNCVVQGENPRTVVVVAGQRAEISFTIDCIDNHGALTVTTVTAGESLDPDGYGVSVDDRASGTIGTNGTLTIASLLVGQHTVTLTGVAGNCTVQDGASRTATITSGGTTSVAFAVRCASTIGDLQVSTATSGEHLDPDGYIVTVDGGATAAVGVNGTVSITGLAAGSHSVSLGGVAANCTVNGANPQTVQVSTGATTAATFAVLCTAAAAPPVLLMAGDIAGCTFDDDEATAKLLDSLPGTVLTLGDNSNPNATLSEYLSCYDPTWGRHKARTHPIPGNHEYYTAGAPGYFAYFGAAAGDPGKGYYSFDVGTWHIIMMNSACPPDGSCTTGGVEETWLRADLAAHPGVCTLVAIHKPRFHSNDTGGNSHYSFWTDFYEMGVDLVVSGDYHWYERFRPMTRDGVVDLERGVRQLIVGTGGVPNMAITSVRANSEARSDDVHGVLKLTLNDGSYAWEFVPVAGESYRDSGSWPCH